MPSTSPKEGLIKTEGMGLIVEVELNAEVLNDRKAIAGNILRFNEDNILSDLSKAGSISSAFLF